MKDNNIDNNNTTDKTKMSTKDKILNTFKIVAIILLFITSLVNGDMDMLNGVLKAIVCGMTL